MTKPSAAALHRPVLESNRIALGTWTIGGPWTRRGQSSGLGQADEGESIAALHSGFDGGITFIDTADVYGCGRAETIIGKALGKHRDEIEIATKFGTMFDEHRREAGERCVTPAFIRRSCEASLRRLNTDRIDLYQLHWAACPVEYLDDVVGTLEGLRTEGKIVSFGFNTDDPSQAAAWFRRTNGVLQHTCNLLEPNGHLISLAGAAQSASFCRSPLATGALVGSRIQAVGDARQQWRSEYSVRAANYRRRLAQIADASGTTAAELAMRWSTWRAPHVMSIVGFRSVDQVKGICRANSAGALSTEMTTVLNELSEESDCDRIKG